MGAPVPSATETDVAVLLAGLGSFVPETRVSNRQILDRVRPARAALADAAVDGDGAAVLRSSARGTARGRLCSGRSETHPDVELVTYPAGGYLDRTTTANLGDDDRRNARVRTGDLVVFMWIGAGNGAMNGYAALVL